MSSLTVLNHEIHQYQNLYSLNDLHKASGNAKKHQPAFFMRNQETKDLVAELELECSAYSQNTKPVMSLRGNKADGTPQGTYVCKEIVYRYAMWISPKFALAVIRVFDTFANGKLQPTQPQIDMLSSVADRKPLVESVNRLVDETGAIYSNVWKMVHQQFNVESVDQLTKEQVKQAIAYIHLKSFVAWKPCRSRAGRNAILFN